MEARFLLVCILALGLGGGASAAETVDLQLVLAVDASGSVDPSEYDLQLQGIALGFHDAAVLQAIHDGPNGAIAVNLLVWADHQEPQSQSGWFRIGTAAEAYAFGRVAANFPRAQNGATGIGDGIAAAIRSFDGDGFISVRKVVDVSGDGEETPASDAAVMLPQAHAMALALHITVNGLAITNQDAFLGPYYENAVKAGPGSFVMTANSYNDYAEALRRKLLREIQYKPMLTRR